MLAIYLINSRYSHTLRNLNDWTIQLGMTRRHSHAHYGQKIKVKKVIPHPQYNDIVAHDNDIALFQVSFMTTFFRVFHERFPHKRHPNRRYQIFTNFSFFLHCAACHACRISRSFAASVLTTGRYERACCRDKLYRHRMGKEGGQKLWVCVEGKTFLNFFSLCAKLLL